MNELYSKILKELNNLSEKEKKVLLERLRSEVDGLDKQILNLLYRRTINSILIGRIKKSIDLSNYTPGRENEIIKKVKSFSNDPDISLSLQRIYERIIDESRDIQKIESKKGKIFKIPNYKDKINWKNLLTKKEFLIIIGFFLTILFIFYFTFFTANHYEAKSPVKFEIKKGETLDEIVDDLYLKGIIPSKTNMKIAAFIYGAEKKMRAARYYIPNNLSYLDLLDLFLNGNADFVRNVYIREGLTIKWMAYKLHHDALIDSADFVNLARDKDFVDSLGLNQSTMQGYLFPKDYLFYENSTAREVIDSMYKSFKEFWTDSLMERAKELGYSIHQIITLASIVKGETNDTTEMPVIAEVYYNRLKKGMKLQADPTVQYLQPNGWKKLTYKDLQIDSPFNTYLYAGLPPGPINNPGKNAIHAALYPDNNNYLYFVANGKGGHNFAKTYSGHLRNVRIYKRWLRTQKSN